MIQRLPVRDDDSQPPNSLFGTRTESPYHRPHDPFVTLPVGIAAGEVVKKPSLRNRRRRLTWACTAFTLGALFILCSSPFSNEFLVPGPLTSHHAPLVASEGGARCAACHANARGSLVSWIAGTFTAAKKQGLSQSELCMKCHEQSLASNFAMNPHNVDPQQLATMTAQIPAASGAARPLFQPPVNHDHQIACSVCHQEHHGGNDLTMLTDAQCQSCHGNKFHSFEHGHPEFVNWPQARRSRIAFDHTTHASRHFIDKHQEFKCSQCHLDDSFQNVKRLASYEQSCAACHNEQILDSGSQGLALIALPMLDMAAIESAGWQIGGWPLAATGDFDGEIPPMMRLLLMADPAANEILKTRGPAFEFFDFDATKPADVADAVALVWATKRLLGELASDGPQAIRTRLQSVLGFELSSQELSRIITNLDGPVFQTAVQAWLPQLSAELLERQLRKSTADFTAPLADDGTDLRFHLLSGQSHARQFSLAKHTLNVPTQPSADDELLAVNPLTDLMKAGGANGAQTIHPNDLLPAEEPLPTVVDPVVTVLPLPSQVQAARPSGWYRNDQTFRISYRPSGHADDCLQSWIELVARTEDAPLRPETQRLFEKTISATGVGLCRTCHTLDQSSDRSFVVNWVAEYRDPSIRSFTRFAHGPHLLQPELQDCSHCHHLDSSLSNAASFLTVDASQVVSNFSPLTKSNCTSCHQQGRTNSNCTQCHNYHVGSKIIGSK